MAGDVGYGLGVGGAQVIGGHNQLQQSQAPQIMAAKDAQSSNAKAKKRTEMDKLFENIDTSGANPRHKAAINAETRDLRKYYMNNSTEIEDESSPEGQEFWNKVDNIMAVSETSSALWKDQVEKLKQTSDKSGSNYYNKEDFEKSVYDFDYDQGFEGLGNDISKLYALLSAVEPKEADYNMMKEGVALAASFAEENKDFRVVTDPETGKTSIVSKETKTFSEQQSKDMVKNMYLDSEVRNGMTRQYKDQMYESQEHGDGTWGDKYAAEQDPVLAYTLDTYGDMFAIDKTERTSTVPRESKDGGLGWQDPKKFTVESGVVPVPAEKETKTEPWHIYSAGEWFTPSREVENTLKDATSYFNIIPTDKFAGPNKTIDIANPDKPDETITVRPIEYRQYEGSDSWQLYAKDENDEEVLIPYTLAKPVIEGNFGGLNVENYLEQNADKSELYRKFIQGDSSSSTGTNKVFTSDQEATIKANMDANPDYTRKEVIEYLGL